ncbi:hypothetical protein RN001_004305 [Aquatica leii]|uniref:HAT C-terminal dimerisation domain-containing protein n=1 Tax=Aquatica leii TaxID=1421715 RepID=A0AAN7PI65_9COLE|nr:hypothetical protein RN001_004305 [Aquatica leii]
MFIVEYGDENVFPNMRKGGNQASKSLVTVPYKKWKHAIEDFEPHQSKQYHHEAVFKGSNFLKTMQNQHLDIRNVIDSGRRKQVDNTTAQPLADTIIASLKNLDLDCNNMVGQGYDGAAVIKGAFNGVQAIIRKSFPRALFVHCSSHYLNLALSTLTVCREVLQSLLCDLITAVDHIENVISHFQDIRSNIEKEFSNSFTEAKNLLTNVNEEIKLPRLTSVQKYRANPNTSNPEKYYRITVAIPLLEDLTSQLKIRFTDHKKVIAAMYTLIATVCSEKETPFPREDLVMYEDLVELDEAQDEFQLWKLFWQRKSPDRPSCAIEAVGECNRQLYPNIYMLLNSLSTLPVTTCTPERSFSTLRRLKTYLRNSCGQERLTGLALIAIHRDVIIPTDDVITEFAHKKSRRLDFVL